MKIEEITVLMVDPGKYPKVTTLKDGLDSLQKNVSFGVDYQGLIEFVNLGNGDCVLCNEEEKIIGLGCYRRLGNDIPVGVFYIMSKKRGWRIGITFCAKDQALYECLLGTGDL